MKNWCIWLKLILNRNTAAASVDVKRRTLEAKYRGLLTCYKSLLPSVTLTSSNSWCQPPTGLLTTFVLLSVAGLLEWGGGVLATLPARGQVCRSQLLLALASVIILGSEFRGNVRFHTLSAWSARFPYLYPPGTGWSSYTPRHWVPVSSATTRRGYS
jgi:hypothetical protein